MSTVPGGNVWRARAQGCPLLPRRGIQPSEKVSQWGFSSSADVSAIYLEGPFGSLAQYFNNDVAVRLLLQHLPVLSAGLEAVPVSQLQCFLCRQWGYSVTLVVSFLPNFDFSVFLKIGRKAIYQDHMSIMSGPLHH